jgi:hypothetical protein
MTAFGPKRRITMSAPMSAVGDLSGLVVLAPSLAARDPKQSSIATRSPSSDAPRSQPNSEDQDQAEGRPELS